MGSPISRLELRAFFLFKGRYESVALVTRFSSANFLVAFL